MLKPRYELLPPELLEATVRVLTLSEEKHKDNPWYNGEISWGSQFGALMRHLWKWWSPFHDDLDEETGESHLAHAASRLFMLYSQVQRNIGVDDRKR